MENCRRRDLVLIPSVALGANISAPFGESQYTMSWCDVAPDGTYCAAGRTVTRDVDAVVALLVPHPSGWRCPPAT
jgi:hypothetical protein